MGCRRSTLFVAGFSSGTRARDLAVEFETYGRIVRCDIPAPSSSAARPRYAFVEFDEVENAREAFYGMQGSTLFGSPLNIQWARNEPSRNWRYEEHRDRTYSQSPPHSRNRSRSISRSPPSRGSYAPASPRGRSPSRRRSRYRSSSRSPVSRRSRHRSPRAPSSYRRYSRSPPSKYHRRDRNRSISPSPERYSRRSRSPSVSDRACDTGHRRDKRRSSPGDFRNRSRNNDTSSQESVSPKPHNREKRIDNDEYSSSRSPVSQDDNRPPYSAYDKSRDDYRSPSPKNNDNNSPVSEHNNDESPTHATTAVPNEENSCKPPSIHSKDGEQTSDNDNNQEQKEGSPDPAE